MTKLLELFLGPSPTLRHAGPWVSTMLCASCSALWRDTSPCGACGEYSRPTLAVTRSTVHGQPWRLWTWVRRTEIKVSTEDAKTSRAAA